MIFLRKMRGFYPHRPTAAPKVYMTKRIRGALTLTTYSVVAVQAEAPMTAPEEGGSSPCLEADHFPSFGQKYFGECEGLAPRHPLAAGACHA